ncbi:MAG: hypothetical protein ACE15C_08250, partial [Phycisphaerae bacterium]
ETPSLLHRAGGHTLVLGLGECSYELGDLDAAGDELARAYLGGGAELFDKQDPKYFEYLRTRLRPPPGEKSI